MSKSEQDKAHLVGSFPAANAEEAMRKHIAGLKDILISAPKGELGWRDNFTTGLVQNIASQNPLIGRVWRRYEEKLDPLPVPALTNEESKAQLVTIVSDPDPDLGYSDDAVESYQTFLKLCEEIIMGKDIRFQICWLRSRALVYSPSPIISLQ